MLSRISMVFIVFIGFVAPASIFSEEAKPLNRKQVAILIFDGVELLDFAGPAEVFIVCEHGKAFNVFTVAPTKDDVRTMGGITVKPDYSLQNSPQADILIVPGGAMSNVGGGGVKWIRRISEKAEIVMSVCMGAFLLAEAGLLDGIEATTHRWGLASLKTAAPKCRVVAGKRFVDNGKVISTAGVTAGIDGALHVVGRLRGKESARWTAEEWMEYRRPASDNPPISKSSKKAIER